MTMYQIQIDVPQVGWKKFGEPFANKSQAHIERINRLGFLRDDQTRVEPVEVNQEVSK